MTEEYVSNYVFGKPTKGYPVGEKIKKRKEIPSFVNEPTAFDLSVWETYDELAQLLLDKHKDYGPKNIAESPGGPLNGLRVRMHDKLARINNLIDKKREPENESLEDSFKDMANYAIIGLLVLRGKWDSD